jgi:D-beta-D-heptose 7-phosphate kinase/D-beta-D-heptose 1-phosphate adenosyltransferase
MSRPLLVVVGDTLLDRDVDGRVRRVAPDAPAPIVEEESSIDRPGGAGLAAVFAAGEGFDVALVTAIADDAGGARLGEMFAAAGVEVYPLSKAGATPEKIRVRAGGRVLMRLDRGGSPSDPQGAMPAAVPELLSSASAILVSDYGNGITRHPQVRASLADRHRAPMVWDPQPQGSSPVPRVRLVTPNLCVAREISGDAGGGSVLVVAARCGQVLRRRWRAGSVAVTIGSGGAVLCQAGPTPMVVPAPSVSDGDTCGAGDRFAVGAALALAADALLPQAVEQAVASASRYVAAGRVRAVPDRRREARAPARDVYRLLAEVRASGGTVVATGGCFDLLHAGHVATLQAGRKLGDCLVVCLNSDDSIRRVKGPDRPLTGQSDRRRLLEALHCVDAVVVFDEPTPEAVLTWLRPDIWVKGGDYADGGPDLPEAEVVRRCGGQTVLVPYLDGRSTAGTIAAARGRAAGA